MMKFVHICLCSPYTDNWGYQENILPRIQAKTGDIVTVIATCTSYGIENSTKIVEVEPNDYILNDGVRVIRVKPKMPLLPKKLKNIFQKYDVFNLLKDLSPDAILIHGLGAYGSNNSILKFLKSEYCRFCFVSGDTHRFLEIAPRASSLKHKLLQYIHEREVRKLLPFYDVIYGVTPDCIDYAINYNNVSAEKIKLLPLGYDSSLIDFEHREYIRNVVREKYNINNSDILIVHGGKINARRKTIEAIEAFNKVDDSKHAYKMIIFGGLSEESKQEFEDSLSVDNTHISYVGSLKQKDYLDLFLAADLGLFPGGQSVLWQEAIGCGLPLVLGKAQNVDYLNLGGNVCFVDGSDVKDIAQGILTCLTNLDEMKCVAESNIREFFSYDRIAEIINNDVQEWRKGN